MSRLEKNQSTDGGENSSANRRIFRGLVHVGFFVLIGKIVAAIREVVIAHKYGVSEIVDVYVFAFVLASWLPVAWAGVLNAVYVPLVHRISNAERQQFDHHLHKVILFWAIVLSLLFSMLMPASVPYIAAEMSAHSQDLLAKLFLQMGPIIAFGLLAAHYSAILLSAERHSNTLVEVVPPIVVLILILLWTVPDSITPLALGSILGAMLQAVVLYYLLKRHKVTPRMLGPARSDKWRTFKEALGWLALSQLIMSMIMPFDQIVAARLDAGSVSVLSYANRLLALALGLGVTAISRAVLPVLSDNNIDYKKRMKIARQWFVVMLVGGFVALLLGWALSPWVVKILFERGAFTAEDTKLVAEAVRYGLIQVPFYFSSIVFVQLFASLSAYRYLIISAFLGFAVKVSTAPLFAEHFGITGIMISTSLMYAVNAIFLFIAQYRYKHQVA